MSLRIRTIFFVAMPILVSGCVLPIPHKRNTRPQCEGIVTDEITCNPVTNASVTVYYGGVATTNITAYTDCQGRWVIPAEEGWHGAIFIGFPMSYSLFPFYDYSGFPTMVIIKAPGYNKWEWSSYPALQDFNNLAEDSQNLDPWNAKLSRPGIGSLFFE